MQEKLIDFASKLSANKYIIAMRDGFAVTLPFTLVGSFFVLITSFQNMAINTTLVNIFGENWVEPFLIMNKATLPLLSLVAMIGITYSMCQQLKEDPLMPVLTALAVYFLFLPASTFTLEDETIQIVANSYGTDFMGAKGFFVAILIGILIPIILSKMSRVSALNIKLPDTVPPAVIKSFLILIPFTIVIIIAGLLEYSLNLLFDTNLFEFVYLALQTPLRNLIGDSYLGGLFSLFFTLAAWIFGIHGGLLMAPFNNIAFGELMPANIEAFAAGEPIPYLFTGTQFFESYAKLGGGGNVLALIIAILIVSKRKELKVISNTALAPALFNISEPMVFGVPIVLNPIIAIPFILSSLATYTIAFIFVVVIQVVPPQVLQVPWTTPIILSGYISTGGSILAGLLQLGLLVVSVLIYIPFVKMNDKVLERNQD